MKYVLLLITCLAFTGKIDAQSRQGSSWILGAYGGPNGSSTEFGGTQLKFSSNSVSVELFTLPLCGGVTAIGNDEAGNIQCYTSGCEIFNSFGEVIENGDSVGFPDLNTINQCYKWNRAILNIWSSTHMLPVPERENVFLLSQVNLWVNPNNIADERLDKLYYSIVDMNENNGHGKVLTKHQVIVDDSLHDQATAVRHGNGRDWWLVVSRGTEREFWEVLITPDGPQKPVMQKLPPQKPWTWTYKYENEQTGTVVDSPYYEYNFESWDGEAVFSPDGSKLCRIVPGNGVEIFSFDRCSGEMELLRAIDMPLDLFHPETPVKTCGICVSPNNRYLYFNTGLQLFQFDLCEENLKKGEPTLIDTWDGLDIDFGNTFFLMRNAPDGKIYMSCPSGSHALHVIHEPNKAGKMCRFEENGLTIPRWHYAFLPDFPNFNLFDVPGSLCDSLGIDDPNPPKLLPVFTEFSVFPNPASNSVHLFIPECDGASVSVWNIAGQKMTDIPFVPGMTDFEFSVEFWAAGVYLVVLRPDDDAPIVRKLVIAR